MTRAGLIVLTIFLALSFTASGCFVRGPRHHRVRHPKVRVKHHSPRHHRHERRHHRRCPPEAYWDGKRCRDPRDD